MTADISIVALSQAIRNQERMFIKQNDFSTTIAAGARSALTNLTGILYNKICIVGLAISSEANTDWRIKFYRKDTGVVTTYATNTYCGELEITNLSANATPSYEGDVEANLYYEDKDLSNEIHLIAENIGSVTSKVLITISYTASD